MLKKCTEFCIDIVAYAYYLHIASNSFCSGINKSFLFSVNQPETIERSDESESRLTSVTTQWNQADEVMPSIGKYQNII